MIQSLNYLKDKKYSDLEQILPEFKNNQMYYFKKDLNKILNNDSEEWKEKFKKFRVEIQKKLEKLKTFSEISKIDIPGLINKINEEVLRSNHIVNFKFAILEINGYTYTYYIVTEEGNPLISL